MAEKKTTDFEKLYALNVNDKTEKKEGLTYLSWAWAWAEFKKAHPNATYEVKKFDNGLPYAYDEQTGYMVYTSVTVDDLTHEMWLPVMDSHNKAMKNHPYEVKTKYSSYTVASATMFDVNKTIMRCLTKNLAMFGLGLYIYAGEDLPDTDEAEIVDDKKLTTKPQTENLDIARANLKGLLEQTNSDVALFLVWCGKAFKREISSVDELSLTEVKHATEQVKKQKGVA